MAECAAQFVIEYTIPADAGLGSKAGLPIEAHVCGEALLRHTGRGKYAPPHLLRLFPLPRYAHTIFFTDTAHLTGYVKARDFTHPRQQEGRGRAR